MSDPVSSPTAARAGGPVVFGSASAPKAVRVPSVRLRCRRPGASGRSRGAQAPGTRKGPLRMAKNIYVGNLAWGCTSDDLLQIFSQHGKVTSAQVIMDRETNRSRGFGFVEM